MSEQQSYIISKQTRESRNQHRSFVIWFTGFSGSGKSTLANLLEQFFFNKGMQVYVLDGDNIRKGMNRDLDFSRDGRKENIRRIAEVARLFCDAGIIAVTAFISPYINDREMAKSIIGEDSFIEVFLDTTVETCMKRDVKGLYAKAKAGLLKDFTGVDDAYEPPREPRVRLQTGIELPDESLARLTAWLSDNQFI